MRFFEELKIAANDVNLEIEGYRKVTSDKVKEVAKKIFRTENCSTLYYKAKNK